MNVRLRAIKNSFGLAVFATAFVGCGSDVAVPFAPQSGAPDAGVPTFVIDAGQWDSGVAAVADAGARAEIDGGVDAGRPGTTPPVTKILATWGSHNELASARNPGCVDATKTQTGYLANRAKTLELAALIRAKGVAWDLMTDMDYIDAVKRWDTAEVMQSTGGKNLLRYLADLDPARLAIDAHSHERPLGPTAFNMADVVAELIAMGIPSTGIVGGFIAVPTEENWTRYRSPLRALRSSFSWQAQFLWGGGSANHTNDRHATGMWRPKSPTEFFVDDPSQALGNIGNYSIGQTDPGAGLRALLAKLRRGELLPGKIYTATLMIKQCELHRDAALIGRIEATIDEFASATQSGEIVWATLPNVIKAWQTEYGSVPNVLEVQN